MGEKRGGGKGKKKKTNLVRVANRVVWEKKRAKGRKRNKRKLKISDRVANRIVLERWENKFVV